MNFFKSVFADDEPDPSIPNETDTPGSKSPPKPSNPGQDPTFQEPLSNPNPTASDGNAWSFGGLIKTFATKSETVIQTYRRDLEEFGSGLKKETEAIREAASRAVKELPTSIEVAQESIESVWRGTTEIIAQSKDSILSVDLESDSSSDTQHFRNSKRYSRFETQVLAIQSDLSTYSEEPEDLEEFGKWKLGFLLEDKEEEIDNLLGKNGVMEGIYVKLVPNVVDHETFWSRYFYKVFKLKQVEDARANLVKRAISGDDDEDLSWDVDDDENNNVGNSSEIKEQKSEIKEEKSEIKEEKSEIKEEKSELSESVREKEHVEVDREIESETSVVESGSDDRKVLVEEKEDVSALNSEESVKESDEKTMQTGEVESGELAKDSDVSIVSSQPSVAEEEDLGWDEIEDVGSNDDEKKVTAGGSPNRSDLRKRLSAADDEEDLNWDIEDDDEPVKH